MFNRVKNRSEKAIVTMAQAKGQLNILVADDDGTDDAHIQLLIDTAVELSEKYTGRLFSTGTVELLVKNKKSFYLPYGEVESITSAVVTGDSSNAEYSFNPISQIFTFDDKVDISKDIAITYNAGYVKPPNAAIMGSLMLLSSLWENREDTVTGVSVDDIPLNSMSILDSIKLWWI